MCALQKTDDRMRSVLGGMSTTISRIVSWNMRFLRNVCVTAKGVIKIYIMLMISELGGLFGNRAKVDGLSEWSEYANYRTSSMGRSPHERIK